MLVVVLSRPGSPATALGSRTVRGAAAGLGRYLVSTLHTGRYRGHVFIARTHTHNMEHATITSYLKNRYYCYMYLLTICGCINGPVTSDTALLLD